MDIYEKITNEFMSLPIVDCWEELRILFGRVASKKPYHWMLPIWACEGVGGSIDQAISAAVSIACSQISIILVDDMLDSDPRGEYHLVGAPAAANMACAFQAAGLAAIARTEVDVRARLATLCSLNHMTLTTSLGQYWDSLCIVDEETYWEIVRTKSSPFFGMALRIGALLGGGITEVASQLDEFGQLYGEMIQIHDDLNDALEIPANPDWILGRPSLPILFAQTVEHPDRQRFLELCRETLDLEKLDEAQTILIRCGAISYGVHQLVQRHQRCSSILDSIPLKDTRHLIGMLDEVIEPVKKLFDALGDDQFSFPPKSFGFAIAISGDNHPN